MRVFMFLTVSVLLGCGSEEPSSVLIVNCTRTNAAENDVVCNSGDDSVVASSDKARTCSEAADCAQGGGVDCQGQWSCESGACVCAAAVDCAVEPPGTLCAPQKSCTPDGRCAPYDWWLLCGTGPECPDLDCQAAICVQGRCMRWFAEDGEQCLGEFGSCLAGECFASPPKP